MRLLLLVSSSSLLNILQFLPLMAFAIVPPHEHKLCEALGKCWRNGDCVSQPCEQENIQKVQKSQQNGRDEICRGVLCLQCDRERVNCRVVYRPRSTTENPSTVASTAASTAPSTAPTTVSPEIFCFEDGTCFLCDQKGCRVISAGSPSTPKPSTTLPPFPQPTVTCNRGVCYICAPSYGCIQLPTLPEPVPSPSTRVTTRSTTARPTRPSTTTPTTTTPADIPDPDYETCEEYCEDEPWYLYVQCLAGCYAGDIIDIVV